MSDCRHVQEVMEAFVDGELTLDQMLAVEGHVERCELCSERLRFEHSLRLSTQRMVRQVRVPASLRASVDAALRAERRRTRRAAAEQPTQQVSRWLPWRSIVPLAAAAAIALVVASYRNVDPTSAGTASHATAVAMSPHARLEQILEEFVDYHSRAPAPQITEPGLIAQLEPEVGLPVRLPTLAQYGASWEGGGVMAPERGPRAASLRYRLGAHRITVYVYDSTEVPLRAALEPRVVGNLPVYVGGRRGYSIAAAERRGIGYALATDLSSDESAEMVAALALNREDESGTELPLERFPGAERF